MLHLKKVGIFQGLSVGELAAIGIMCKVVSYGAEEVVIREGEPGDTLYLIFEGDVSVIKGEGLEKCSEIAVMTAGDYFGEMALIDDAPRSATVKTKTKARFMILTKRDFGRIAREHPPHRPQHLQGAEPKDTRPARKAWATGKSVRRRSGDQVPAR
ncbi:MAG: cyclic nucleotide-binding domain-containing protein [Deltaproteobacteria bacterium]|nr:cyclic nucleotide-binding domain-containing protein [Deltaproteobacteria bacterium]